MDSTTSGAAYERDSLWIKIRRQPPALQAAAAILVVALIVLVAYFLLANRSPPSAAPPPTPVGVPVVAEQPVTLTTELPGRTSPFETSDVRPQVDGIIRARLFTEGDYVRAGQPLYRIDPVTYEAQRRQCPRRARPRAGFDHRRRRPGPPLCRAGEAQLRLAASYTTTRFRPRAKPVPTSRPRPPRFARPRSTSTAPSIRAPISGRIGRSLYTTGALVRAGAGQSADHHPAARPDLCRHPAVERRPAAAARADDRRARSRATSAPVRLQLETGSMYPLVGTLELRRRHRRSGDRLADHPRRLPQSTAPAAPRACSSAAQLSQGVQSRGILVPQRAVSRDERGRPTVLVVGKNNMAELRVIQADRTVGDNWLVTGGLKPGDKVIVDAGPLLRPGVPVKPQLSRAARRLDVALLHRPADLRLGDRHPDDAVRAARDPRRCRSRNFPRSPRRRSASPRSIPAPTRRRSTRPRPRSSSSSCRASTTCATSRRNRRRRARSPITLTFDQGTDPDIAQVQVHNKVQAALPLLAAGGPAPGRQGREILGQFRARPRPLFGRRLAQTRTISPT